MKRSKKKKIIKRTIKNIKVFFLATGIILIWRGVWNLLDYYLMPDMFILSNMLGIMIGVLILLIDDFSLNELKSK
ncbi:MAG: hypothetical protein PHH06_02635 [Candidatus Gracilibacteria bacterium]|nr:hypothetical protein [Candidatus Gracilibacteria bacterium]